MLYDELVQPGEYICHHGIKGQKWGIRRYQNADGSLTEEGRRRYMSDIKRLRQKGSKVKTHKQSHNLWDKKGTIYSKIIGEENISKLRDKRNAITQANKKWWEKLEQKANSYLSNEKNILEYTKKAGYSNSDTNNLSNIFGTNNISTIRDFILENMAESGDDGIYDLKAMGLYDKEMSKLHTNLDKSLNDLRTFEKQLTQMIYGPSASQADDVDVSYALHVYTNRHN